MNERVPITYTFGNHNHWVDMEWLWGYDVFPSSVHDMLHFCHELGAKGNVNFEGIGYEKLASENPPALTALRHAVQEGTVEIIGGSYGQPYGLFQGGESNVRQRIYGARTCQRLLGKRPRTFWEEEFDFFPQLPQILAGCGYQYASLFFQWTWHTPEVPKEEVPVIWWEGQDGSRLLTATRNRLNLHQWPEDIQILMDELATTGTANGDLILQWLELMPTPDWMCRSEVLLPKTKELLGDPRFDVTFATLGEYLSKASHDVPTRRYTMDDVWHGMSLGKNADLHPRTSHQVERRIQEAESLFSILSLFGRPYAQWDVYPTWELEEAWRNLLAAQHHDNHECEGLCGRVGYVQFEAARTHAEPERAEDTLVKRAVPTEGGWLVTNPFGWERRIGLASEDKEAVVTVSSYGYEVVSDDAFAPASSQWTGEGKSYEFQGSRLSAKVDLEAWRLELTLDGQHRSMLLPQVRWKNGGSDHNTSETTGSIDANGRRLEFLLEPEGVVAMWFEVPITEDGLDLTISFEPDTACDPGLNAGAHAVFKLSGDLIVDQPYGISKVHPHGKWLRKYPTGDWMTSPQWFETVENPFTSQSFVDVLEPSGEGLLIMHNGSQQWFEGDQELRCVLTMYDPWDEARFDKDARTTFRLFPHAGITNGDRYRRSRELFGLSEVRVLPGLEVEADASRQPDMPTSFSLASCSTSNVAMTALYREMIGYSKVDGYAADWEYPYVLRLVELDGIGTTAVVQLNATVARAIRTDLMGCNGVDLSVDSNTISVPMRPFEIATVYLDLVEGRKQFRDLDAKRKIWATVHRVEEE